MFNKRITRCLPVLFAALIALPVAAQTQLQSRATPLITSPIDNSVRVTVAHSTHHLAQSRFDIGPLDGGTAMDRMILVLKTTPELEYQARTFLDSQQTKGSPDYQHWLTPEEFGAKFGPSPADIQQVTNWLRQQGFKVSSVAKSGRWIEFSGTSAQVEAAFQTTMRQYMVAGRQHVANATDISIPAALSPIVRGVLSLHNFYSKPMHKRYRPDANVPFGNQQIHAIAPADFTKIYDLNPLYTNNINGTGQTIAIVAASNINTIANNGVDDVANFRSLFGLPVNPPNIILNGPDPGVDTFFGLGDEATLDTEWSGAVAPKATIDVVVSGGTFTTDPISLGASYIVDQNLAPVMSVSFGDCEENQQQVPAVTFWNGLWQQAAAQGISVFVSSGDSGAAGCDAAGESTTAAQFGVAVSNFASTPFNTAVGGTEFNETFNNGLDSTFWNETANTLSSANGYIPETVWNDSCSPTSIGTICPHLPPASGQFLILAGGGGVSTIYHTPSYQMLSGIPGLNSTVLGGFRGLPDISLAAAVQHDPYIFCFTTDPTAPDCQLSGGLVTANTFQSLAGGTSFSSPAFAGIMALIDQKLGKSQGLANYVLYSLAKNNGNFANCNSNSRTNPGTGTSCIFNDTTVGNNGVPGNDVTNDPTTGALGFPTTTGYDLATGLGSVDATNLVNAWNNVTFQGSQTALTITSPALTAGVLQITHGQTVQVSIGVQKAGGGAGPTGNIAVVTNQAAPGGGTFAVGSGILSGGAFSGSFNTLPGGSYNLTAHYPGDGTFAGSDSNAIPATVAPENSTTTLASLVFTPQLGVHSGNTVNYGDPLDLLAVDADTAGVSGLLPAHGTVTFTINGSPSAPVAIDNSGIAEYFDCVFPDTNCLPPGQYTFSATYSGDGLSYNGSSSTSSISVTITKGNPTVVVTGPSTTPAGTQITLTATVNEPLLGSITPTGTVQFFDAGVALGSPITVSPGSFSATANLQTSFTAGGPHNITAQYSGDSTYNNAGSQAFVENVTAPFNFTATTSSQTIAAGGTATYNVTLAATGSFTGQINFTCTGAPGGASCSVSPNPASLTSTTTSVPLTVTVSNTTNARRGPSPFRTWSPLFAAVVGIVACGASRKRRYAMFMLLSVFLIVGITSCGGGGGTIQRPPTVATLTVTGTSGSFTNSIQLTLTVTH